MAELNPGGRGGFTARRGFLVAVVLVVAMLVVQLVTSISAAILSSRDANAASQQLFGVVGDVTIERVGRYAQAAEDAVGESVLELGRTGAAFNLDAVAANLYDRIHLSPQLGAIKVGWANGDYVELRRDAGGYTLRAIVVEPTRVVTVRTYDESFNLLRSVHEAEDVPYDPTTRPWYVNAVAESGITWTDPYLLFESVTPAVSAAQAARSNGNVVAVVAADLLLDQLAVVLDGLPVGNDGEAFVFDQKGTVVAAPGAYTQRIEAIARNDGRVATREDLGVQPTPTDISDSEFRSYGAYAVVERAFPSKLAAGWVLHLRATRSGLAPSLGAWEKTVVWTTALSALVFLGAVILMIRVWRPLLGMRSRASTDALTGLANRHEFQSLGSRMVASASSDRTPLFLVLVDLDAFKSINDTLGHDAGDAALAAAAEALLDGTRARDLVARIGGDEFAMVQRMDEETDDEVADRVEELRSRVAERLVAIAPGVPNVGATAGYVIDRSGSLKLDGLLRRADGALIHGKAERKGVAYAADGE